MKKTLTVNLNGLVFTIDEDAYEKLQHYLQDVNDHFKEEDDAEIISDIETRIAEIFTERLNKNRNVVTIDDVDFIISTLGNPDQFDEDENYTPNTTTNDNKENKEKRKHRKFYRDIDDQILGGVAAGLALYIGIDVTIVRILFILLTVASFSWMIVIYVLLWIICPPALTTSQKLEMQGIEPSIENIKNYISNLDIKQKASTMGSVVGKILKITLKILAIIVGIITCSVIIGALGFIIITCLSFLSIHPSIPGISITMAESILMFISIILIITLPILLIIVSLVHVFKQTHKSNKRYNNFLWTTGIIWLICLIFALFILFKYNISPHKIRQFRNYFIPIENTISENRLSDYSVNSVDVSSAINVLLQHDTVNYVEISGNEEFLRGISIDTANNQLFITKTSTFKSSPNNVVILHYTQPFNKITTSSAASISNIKDSILVVTNMTLNANSASEINLKINCDSLFVDSSSASDIVLEGNCNYSYFKATSASTIKAKKLKCKNSNINSTSASTISVNSDTLLINVKSGSEVKYNKNNKMKEIVSSTSGTAIPYSK